MSEVFVIRNQSGHFWGKRKAWVDGSDARAVLRVKHRDEAANTLFELSSKDFELRGDIVAAELGPKGEPMVEVSDIPLPVIPSDDPDTDEGAAAEATATETPEAKDSAEDDIDGVQDGDSPESASEQAEKPQQAPNY